MPASEDAMWARARDFLRDIHLELPCSAERRFVFALETFRTAAHAAGRAEGYKAGMNAVVNPVFLDQGEKP